MLTSEKSHTLDSLVKHYNIPLEGRHTSIGDALMTAEILVEFLSQLAKRKIYTLEDLNNYLHWRAYQ